MARNEIWAAHSLQTLSGHAAAAVGVLALGLGLAACSAGTTSSTQSAAESILGGDITMEDGNLSIDASAGAFGVGPDLTMPDTWPTSVPAFNRGNLIGVEVIGDQATATWSTQLTPEDALGHYRSQLVLAGMNIVTEVDSLGQPTLQATGRGYRVNATAIDAGPQTSMIVTAVAN
ncbi:MAG: hypothetical protein KGN78_12200 [Actinomycetales bacterium]|nr:hypothetical protein [Actinomycetales bacterium]